MSGKVFVVLNPMAGRSKPEHVREILDRHFGSYHLYRMTGEERLPDVVRTAMDADFDLFLAAGGDGTVAGVAGGLVHANVPLGILPTGTGNILARKLGIPHSLEAAAKLVAGVHDRKKIDGMQIKDRVFILNASAGISSLTMRDTRMEEKRRFGMVAYFWTGMLRWLGFKPHYFTLCLDGRNDRLRASEIFVANASPPMISNLPPGINVRLDDGELDVFIVRARTVADYVRLFWSVSFARQSPDSELRFRTVRREISIASDPPLPVQADGEAIGYTPVEVVILPAAVEVIVPSMDSLGSAREK
jgi:diacylglycerol kinase (ATP)